uniref:Golgi brefeldin A resistant guanine nucleotide exchange factor 1 n=1 Tax=Rousettus aegyptiacus TaxID=9407 RepID=A0A7J8G8E2_ROUAE|nr:golgi brefeldin A resistant guanine nucleotide exchange factor 1 [Rousettus aegyptiacus]
MRAGGMSDSSKWKKQKRSPRPPRHMTRGTPGSELPASNGTTLSSNLTGGMPFIDVPTPISSASSEAASAVVSPSTDSGLEFSSQTTSKEDLTDLEQPGSPGCSIAAEPGSSELGVPEQPEPQEGAHVEKVQSASVESIPEVLEECTSPADHSDSASVHDMDYVNPRGVRFTQSSQKEGTALVPYGLPCIRELFRFLISLTNPHDRHNSEVMIHMGLHLLTVALESAPIAQCQSLLGLIKDEMCRHLFQLLSVERLNLYAASLRVCFLLFESMREHLKFQLEMYIKKLMEIITVENAKMPYEMKEMALEAIVQLWHIPSFVTELYINYDCDYYCSNLFEDLTKLLRLAIRLLRREEISGQVLLSLRILLLMKPSVLSRVSHQVAFGLHELLKTNAANIHSSDDWATLFTLLECIGSGVKPPAALQATARADAPDAGAQSDSELPSYHQNDVSLDRGYTSDSEVYTDHGRPGKIHRSATDADVVNSGWLVVGKDDIDNSKPGSGPIRPGPSPLVNQYSLTVGVDLGPHDTKSLLKCVESLSFIVRDAAHITPDNFELCVKTLRIFVEASLNGGWKSQEKRGKSHKYDSKGNRFKKKSKEGSMLRRPRTSSQHATRGGHSDDDEDEGVPASYHTVSLQLLDLMHTLHTRAASIYSSWAEEQRHLETGGRKIEADSRTLWAHCWCPLLQGIACLCCDARRQVRMQALTYLQRALLVHDLQKLDALEWESCFNKVLFPLLTKLLENISPADVGGMEETRMRASTLLSKVFLQHLSPLLSLSTFAALWLTILDFMDKYMHAGSSDLLSEAIPESLKNMLLVMDTAEIFHSADARGGSPSALWEITWERIDCFLPHLRDELFKQTVIQDPIPVELHAQKPLASAHLTPAAGDTRTPGHPPPPEMPSELGAYDFEKPDDPRPANSSSLGSPAASSPSRLSPTPEGPPPLVQPPLILQPLASPLQVGVPPMTLPIILNPALIEATSPVPLLATPRPTDPMPTSEVN